MTRHYVAILQRQYQLRTSKVSNWLAVNKVSLNINNTKYIIMHTKNKYIIKKQNIIFNGKEIQCVHNFN